MSDGRLDLMPVEKFAELFQPLADGWHMPAPTFVRLTEAFSGVATMLSKTDNEWYKNCHYMLRGWKTMDGGKLKRQDAKTSLLAKGVTPLDAEEQELRAMAKWPGLLETLETEGTCVVDTTALAYWFGRVTADTSKQEIENFKQKIKQYNIMGVDASVDHIIPKVSLSASLAALSVRCIFECAGPSLLGCSSGHTLACTPSPCCRPWEASTTR